MTSKLAQLDSVIQDSLHEFLTYINTNSWLGREREAVSLFAFGFLVPKCRKNTVLFDPRQIAIECAIPQLPGPSRKKHVCKDLLIWPRPSMTCWDKNHNPVNIPLSILEWKFNARKPSSYDIAWLTDYSKKHRGFVGYVILLRAKSTSGYSLHYDMIIAGTVSESREIA